MNPISLYVDTCRTVLKARENDSSMWTELSRLVPELRTSLSCSVCLQLASVPLSPHEPNTDTHTHQILCDKCVLNTDNGLKYVPNDTLRILIVCFKKLCEYVMTGPILRYTSKNEGLSNMVDILLDCVGSEFKPTNGTDNNEIHAEEDALIDVVANGNQHDDIYTTLYEQKYRSKIVKKKPAVEIDCKRTKLPPDGVRTRHTKNKIVLKKGCRCGNATLTPGKLTCCGQRCPCYVSSKGCADCRCKGCRNPHKGFATSVDVNSDVEVL